VVHEHSGTGEAFGCGVSLAVCNEPCSRTLELIDGDYLPWLGGDFECRGTPLDAPGMFDSFAE
jgi:hypothetical protein